MFKRTSPDNERSTRTKIDLPMTKEPSVLDDCLKLCTDVKGLKSSRRVEREERKSQQAKTMLFEPTKAGLHTFEELRKLPRAAGPTLPPSDSREFNAIANANSHSSADEPQYTPLSSNSPPLHKLEKQLRRLEDDAERLRMPLKKLAAHSPFKSLYNLKACINAAKVKEGHSTDFSIAAAEEKAAGSGSSSVQNNKTFNDRREMDNTQKTAASSNYNARDQYRSSSSKTNESSSHSQVSNNKSRNIQSSTNSNNSSAAGSVQTDDFNKLSAQLLRAEMLGSNPQAIVELKNRIAAAKVAAASTTKSSDAGSKNNIPQQQASSAELLMKSDSKGQLRPVASTASLRSNASIQELVRYEKEHSVSDAAGDFINVKRRVPKTGEDGEYDDVADDARGGMTTSSSTAKRPKVGGDTLDKMDRRERERAILEHKTRETAFEKCSYCLDNQITPKHLIIAVGEFCYLHLPQGRNLLDFQCEVSPIAHVPSSVVLDENVYEEMQKFKRALTRFCQHELKCDAVFVETHKHRHQYRHCIVECFPVDAAQHGEEMPFAFHNAISASEGEWSQNVKLINLKKRGGLRRAVPKELPFFAVEFGYDGSGYAHVIENENEFPDYFGKEVIAGVLDLEPHLYRRVRDEPFEAQCTKISEFKKMWEKDDYLNDETST